MSVLRSIESKLESLFEGVFGRAFRTNVQPVELARKLSKEMDEHKNVSVSRVYVPNEYTIYLSAGDHEQFASYETQLRDELAEYLAEHARRESYVLLTPPQVQLEVDEDLDLGVFGIATRMVQKGKPEERQEPNATMIYKPSAPAPQPTEAASPVDLGLQREIAVLTWDGARHEVSERRVVLGRSKDADLQVADPNVSRRHAELRQEGATYWLVDLDSTNGVEVKGKRVKRLKLEDGTRFTIGSTEITFKREIA
jgi:pSer/pThr/pTyr-binding forkhead associated (FHA) protein